MDTRYTKRGHGLHPQGGLPFLPFFLAKRKPLKALLSFFTLSKTSIVKKKICSFSSLTWIPESQPPLRSPPFSPFLSPDPYNFIPFLLLASRSHLPFFLSPKFHLAFYPPKKREPLAASWGYHSCERETRLAGMER